MVFGGRNDMSKRDFDCWCCDVRSPFTWDDGAARKDGSTTTDYIYIYIVVLVSTLARFLPRLSL